jgi:glutathione synthase/RimK-type ligase-like ATP-grasp enzyme
MNLRIMGVYREAEFSPGKVEADAAIIDAVLDQLSAAGAETITVDPVRFISDPLSDVHMVLAMCQGAQALSRLAAVAESGAVALNCALAIRNCYRDLLGVGLMRAGVPVPEGALVRASQPLDLKPLRPLDLSSPMYVKRGDLHALGPGDVQRVEGLGQLEATLMRFARRGVTTAYVQQEVAGDVVKFYGVGGGEYFTAAALEGGEVGEAMKLELSHAAAAAAAALGLEVWGGDAIVKGNSFSIIDFNDWPSFERVRDQAARAIARRCLMLMRQHPAARDLAL